MSEGRRGYWSATESPLVIDYSLAVIDEIKRQVAEGFQMLTRGGIEVGGVLYGTREGRTVRIEATRPIACEHPRGPTFLLSDNDRAALNAQLRREQQDPLLQGLTPVGWFLSHTRSEITLNEFNLVVFKEFFGAPWQVTLVIRPGRGGSMRAGFFVREEDGRVKCDHSYLEFDLLDQRPGILNRTPEREPTERKPALEVRSAAVEPPQPAPAEPVKRVEPPKVEAPLPSEPTPISLPVPQFILPKRRRKWLWLAGWAVIVLLVAGAVRGLRIWLVSSSPEPIALFVSEREGQLHAEWNRNAKPILLATRGTLELLDGGDVRTVPLTPEALRGGSLTAAVKSRDVLVRMTVEESNGRKIQEASRFVGGPAAEPAATPASDERRAELEAEVRRLQRQNQAQAARIQQLERTLRILQTRLGIVEDK